jgi:hypothetical protein
VTKRTVLIAVKSFEIIVMVSAVAAFWLADMRRDAGGGLLHGHPGGALQPGQIRQPAELLPDRDISRGNALIEMSTFLAIILGSALGGVIYQAFHDAMPIIGVILLAIAIVGTACAFGIGRTHPRAHGQRRFSWNPVGPSRRACAALPQSAPVADCAWPQLFLVHRRAGAETGDGVRGADSRHSADRNDAIACSALRSRSASGSEPGGGAALGTQGRVGPGADRRCRHHHRALVLASIEHSYAGTMACLGMLGFFGGMYSVPLNAMLQQKSTRISAGR